MLCHYIGSLIIIHIDHQRTRCRIHIQCKISVHLIRILCLISGMIKQHTQNLHCNLRMLIPFTHNYIFIIPKRRIYLHGPLCIRSQIIRLPVRLFILPVLIHKGIIGRPPEAEKRSALSIHHKIPDIILCTQSKIRIQNPLLIKLP